MSGSLHSFKGNGKDRPTPLGKGAIYLSIVAVWACVLFPSAVLADDTLAALRPESTPSGTNTPINRIDVGGTPSTNPVAQVRSNFVSNTPPPYSHSWYIESSTVSKIQQLGTDDGSFDSNRCNNGDPNIGTTKFVVLDFGRAKMVADPGYGGYGTLTINSLSISYTGEVNLAEQYAQAYRTASQTGCNQLLLALGQSNSYICNNSPGCNSADAGRYWASAVNDVNTWLIGQGIDQSLARAVAANDMETAGGDYSCATRTMAWVTGFVNNSNGVFLYNFGDAFTDYSDPDPDGAVGNVCWTIADIYAVSQGGVQPFPQIYKASFVCFWSIGRDDPGETTCVEQVNGVEGFSTDYSRSVGPNNRPGGVEAANSPLNFAGTMTECQDDDVTLAMRSTYCPVVDNPNGVIVTSNQYIPSIAWGGVRNVQQRHPAYLAVQTNSLYSTNIRQQP